MRGKLVVAAGSLSAVALAVACGSADLSGFAADRDGGGAGDAAGEFPSSDAGSTAIPVDAIVLVHAAAFPAFRLCFEGRPADQPTPSADLMPSSNVVGLEVGGAVLLPAAEGPLGRAFLFDERTLRPFYPPGKPGPTCDALLGGNFPDKGVPVGDLQEDLAHGVHLLVLTGCRPTSSDVSATPARCGPDWTPLGGNLALKTIAVEAFARPRPSELPVQALLLSSAIAGAASGRAIGVAFGDVADDGGSLAGHGAARTTIAADLAPYQPAPSAPIALVYDPSDVAAYASRGFVVSFAGGRDAGADAGGGADGGADAGAAQILFTQSLADVQRRSEPNAVPQTWYALGASYVLLALGDPDPRLPDGGADPDPGRAPHLLAMPLSAPDAGADAAVP